MNLLKYLIEYGHYGVRKYIAKNPNTPREFLEQMAEYAIEQELKFDETLETIAKNPKISSDLVEKIAIYCLRKNFSGSIINYKLDDPQRT